MRAIKTAVISDQEIIAGIKEGGYKAQTCTNHLYKQYLGYIIKGIKRYRLSEEDAVDAYADAVLGVCKRIKMDAFRGESKISTYLFRAFQNKCVDSVRKMTTNKNDVEWVDEIPDMPDMAMDLLKRMSDHESVERLRLVMGKLGDRCKQILLDAEYHGYDMEEIASRMGLNGGPSASSMKYRCMQKLKTLIDIKKLDI